MKKYRMQKIIAFIIFISIYPLMGIAQNRDTVLIPGFCRLNTYSNFSFKMYVPFKFKLKEKRRTPKTKNKYMRAVMVYILTPTQKKIKNQIEIEIGTFYAPYDYEAQNYYQNTNSQYYKASNGDSIAIPEWNHTQSKIFYRIIHPPNEMKYVFYMLVRNWNKELFKEEDLLNWWLNADIKIEDNF